MQSDGTLIAQIQQGDRDAMETLVRRYYRDIFAFLYRRAGDYQLALDLTQETMIRMLKSLGSYQENGKFVNWLITIAVNCFRDSLRCAGLRQITPLDENLEDKNAGVILEQQEMRDDMMRALSRLPDAQREAVVLHCCHRFKIREIARLTGSKDAAVKSRVNQGLAKLRKFLAGDDPYENKKAKQSEPFQPAGKKDASRKPGAVSG